MDALQQFVDEVRFSARHLFSDVICGSSPTYYSGSVGYIHYFRGGKLTIMPDGDAAFTLVEPTVIFYPSRCAHHMHGDELQGARMLCSVIDCEQSMRRTVSAALPRVVVIPVAQAPQLKATLDLLMTEADAKSAGWQAACDRLFEYLVTQILRWAVTSGLVDQKMLSGFGDERLAHCLAAIHQDLSQDWTLDRLAGIAAMSRSSFAARFASVLGQTPVGYVLGLRIREAKRLLKQGHSAKMVAARTGFSGSAVFARAFKRHEGQSAIAWLKANSAP